MQGFTVVQNWSFHLTFLNFIATYKQWPFFSPRAFLTDARYNRALRSAIFAALSLAAKTAVSLLSVRLLLTYLSTERFGIWMTIYSFVGFLGFLDFGIGNGLVTALANSHGKDSKDIAQHYVSSAFCVLGGAALCLGLLYFIAFPFIPWGAVFNINSQALADEAGKAMGVFGVCVSATILFSLVRRTQSGFQQEYIASKWELGALLLTLLGIVWAQLYQVTLPWIVGIIIGFPVIAAVTNFLFYFYLRETWLRPSFTFLSIKTVKELLRYGILFFILQIAATAIFSTDNLVITQVIGPGAVTQYSIVRILAQLFLTPILLLLTPLWPAYGEARARGDHVWVAKTFRRSIHMALICSGVGGAIIILGGNTLLSLWLGKAMHAPLALLTGFAAYILLMAVGTAYATLFNAAFIVSFQVIVAIILLIVSLATKIIFAMHFGITGVIWSTVISYGIITMPANIIYTKYKLMKK